MCFNYLIYKSRALNFNFRKFELNMLYIVYSNKLPFKDYIEILGVRESALMLILLMGVPNLGNLL